MFYILLTIFIFIAAYLPNIWVSLTMAKYKKEIADMPGTGGELASHLLERFDMNGYNIEQTTANNDHYDPRNRTIRLSPDNYSGKSLTAIAVAAHEVGHAIQHHRQEKIFQLRSKYIPIAQLLQKTGILLIGIAPLILLITKAPLAAFIVGGASFILQFIGALSYLIVLPEEWDASFNKALPILIDGKYIHANHIDPVKHVLRAAAFTYFAAALASILNIGRWLMILRR